MAGSDPTPNLFLRPNGLSLLSPPPSPHPHSHAKVSLASSHQSPPHPCQLLPALSSRSVTGVEVGSLLKAGGRGWCQRSGPCLISPSRLQ